MEWVAGKEFTEFIESQNEIKKQIDDYIIKFNEISFNISYEEISEEGLSKIKAAYEGKPIEYLQEKIINLHKQINKDRIIVKNQREELHKLNLKLQKCISLEEDIKVITVKNNVIKELENENYLNKSKLHLSSLNNVAQQKEIEKLKAVIEYLESKVK